MHLDPDGPLPLTCLAATAFDVEGEAPRRVSPHFGLRQPGEELADVGEDVGVGGRVGTGCAANGRLIYVDSLINVLHSQHCVVAARFGPAVLQNLSQSSVEYIHQQGALAGARNPGDADELPQGDVYVYALQVVLRRPFDDDLLAVAAPPLLGDGDTPATSQVVASDGARAGHDILQRPSDHDLAAVFAGPRPQVNDVIGGADSGLVVLHDQNRVAQISHPLQGADETGIVPLVQSDGWLIQDVEYSHQLGADLGGQTDALGLPARQAHRRAVQGQVVQAYVFHEAQASHDLFEYPLADDVLTLVEMIR